MPDIGKRIEAVRVGPGEIRSLKQAASQAPLRRARLCMHTSHDDPIQEMVIAVCDDCYIAPHRQQGKTKSYVLLDGRLSVYFFDADGKVEQHIEMSPSGQGTCCSLRFDSSQWHTVMSQSDHSVYTETIVGPYDPEGTDWAPWAPDADDEAAIVSFRAVLEAGSPG